MMNIERCANVEYTNRHRSSGLIVCASHMHACARRTARDTEGFVRRKREDLDLVRFGVVNKAVAVFDTDFWSSGCGNELMLAINQQNASIDSRGMFPYFMNTNKHWTGTNALLGFAVGRYAIASEQKTDAQVQADFMSRIRQQFPNAPNPTYFMRTKWGSDPFAHGSYTTPAGLNARMDEMSILSGAVSASLTLAGEHTHPTWAATVHGAYASGQRAADDIMSGTATGSSSDASYSISSAGVFVLAVLYRLAECF